MRQHGTAQYVRVRVRVRVGVGLRVSGGVSVRLRVRVIPIHALHGCCCVICLVKAEAQWSPIRCAQIVQNMHSAFVAINGITVAAIPSEAPESLTLEGSVACTSVVRKDTSSRCGEHGEG